jgi:hypothetical protein
MRARNIDSFQKLRVILFLQQHPGWTGTGQKFAKKLHLRNVSLVEQLLSDLRQAGLVEGVEEGFKLRNDPDLRTALQQLARAYQNPSIRQKLLDQINPGVLLNRYLTKAHQPQTRSQGASKATAETTELDNM